MADVATANFHGKLTVPKSSLTTEAQGVSSDVEANGEAAAKPVVEKKTPAKRKATPKKAAKKEENGDEPEEPTTPKPKKRAAPKAKKEKEVKSEAKVDTSDEDAAAAGDDAAENPATPPAAASINPAAASSKKRAAKADKGETETPTKKRKTKATDSDAETPAKTPKSTAKTTPKAAKVKFPESWDEFSDGDKLLVNMRREGKNWEDIAEAWTKVTGLVPGKDVLRKKETKLRALAIEWKAGDARKLAEYKAKIEEESIATMKKFEAEKWIKMAEMFKATGSIYSSPGLQKKWELMQRKGEVDAKGIYVGTGDEVKEASAEGSEAAASVDGQVKEDGDAENEGVDAENEDVSEEADNEQV